MRKITLICVGNLKEKYLLEAFNEYEKRLKKYFIFDIIEIPETKIYDSYNIQKALSQESEKILEKIKNKTVFPLTIEGEEMSSELFAKLVEKTTNTSDLCFVIGSSYGLSSVIKATGKNISFSKLTFPHQLMRIIFMEQLYRAGTIINNNEYHK